MHIQLFSDFFHTTFLPNIIPVSYTHLLRICVKDSAQTEQLVQAVIDAGYKAPAIFYSTAETDTTNAQLAQEDFKAAGIDVVGTAQIQPDTEKDYNAHITNFRGAGADVVVFCCEYNPAALFLKQAARAEPSFCC